MHGCAEGFVVYGWRISEEEISERFTARYDVELYWMYQTRNYGNEPLYARRCLVDPETGAAHISDSDKKIVLNAYRDFDAMTIATSDVGYFCCIAGDMEYARNSDDDVDDDDEDDDDDNDNDDDDSHEEEKEDDNRKKKALTPVF